MKCNIAFDVDGTLIHKMSESNMDVPKYDTILLLGTLSELPEVQIYVWSGGGVEYATRWCEKLGLLHVVKIVAKGSFIPDIAFDDEDVALGKVNIKV
jgi:trehalose-6-phosphatase